MDKAFKSALFVSGLLLFLAGLGIAMNFVLRSKSVEIPLIALMVIGLSMAYSGWKESRRR